MSDVQRLERSDAMGMQTQGDGSKVRLPVFGAPIVKPRRSQSSAKSW